MLRTTLTHDRQRWLVFLTYLLITSLALTATAADVSELLEKAIYTEETVGDLDKAIRVYEKVVAESKGSISAAAQAQFRIGTCYAKQGKAEEAEVAFQAVIDNYPKATHWVTKAKSRLPGDPKLIPVPWGDGDELQFEMKLPTGMGIGHQVFRICKIEKEGRTLWECSAWQTVTINGMAGKSRVLVDPENFAPIESQWKHTMLGDSKAKYSKDKVVVKMASKDEPLTIEYDGPVYDNEQGAELFRRLPLKNGYKTKVDIIPILTGTKISLSMHVTKMETIEVPAGTFECFVLFLDDLKQTFWISNDEHRYMVRFEAGGVTADLTEARPFKPNLSTTLKHERFTLTLPPDWYSYTPSDKKDEKKTRTSLIDPTAAMNSRVEAGPLDSIQDEHASPSAWLEHALGDYRKKKKDFSLSEKGIEIINIDGREAATADFEYKEGDKTLTARMITLFGDTSTVNLRFTASTNEFEGLKPVIEEIVASLSIK